VRQRHARRGPRQRRLGEGLQPDLRRRRHAGARPAPDPQPLRTDVAIRRCGGACSGRRHRSPHGGVRLFDNFDLMVTALWQGFVTTVWVTFASYAIALVVGSILVIMHVSPAPPARWAAGAYTQMFRNVPLLAVLFIRYFGLPKIGIVDDSWVWALLGLGLYTGAFVGETLRSGINSIPLGQAEAARSIGLTFGQSLGSVILPQAFRAV